jgi:predicted DNA-binding ribbon-helix-helix protein
MTLARLVAAEDAARDGTTPLASSLRVLALREARIHRTPSSALT